MKTIFFVTPILASVLVASGAQGTVDPDPEPEVEALEQAQPAPPARPAHPAPPATPSVAVIAGARGGYLGVGVADIDSEKARELKLKDEHGVEITRVEEDSPAAKAGLQKGDVVLEYQGQRVEGTEQFQRLVRETPAKRRVKLHISRNGSTQNLTATIGGRSGRVMAGNWPLGENFDRDMQKFGEQMRNFRFEMPDVPRAAMSWRSGALGVVAESLNSQLAEFFGVKQGVLVREVNKDSAAEKAGVRAGDVIVKIDQTGVATPQEVTQAVRAKQRAKSNTFPVTVVRNKQEMVLNVTVEAPRSSGSLIVPRVIVAPRSVTMRLAPAGFAAPNRFVF